LIHRNDSPNGKRYARKDSNGAIETAYGFNLAPLLARAEELAGMAQQVADAQRALKLIKERITLARRDVRKLISAGVEDAVPGNWQRIEALYIATVARLRVAKQADDLADILEDLELLRDECVNLMENQLNLVKSVANGAVIRQHIQNSNTESTNESEPRSGKEQGEKSRQAKKGRQQPVKAFALSMVLRACPEIVAYGPTGDISTWRELMAAAVTVRSMLGVSPSAYQQACEAMGPENAAATMAAILERAGHISSPGGYLRDLTRRAERGEFSLGPMLMALLRARGTAVSVAAG
ncbi:replication initiation protein RepC, partial [Rhizobium sp. RU20A]|uniref:plasmid replication protein RepC n=1 Tax=Rhizobium sp. RU20A TaxID=1907412 RepID=UPI0009568CC8